MTKLGMFIVALTLFLVDLDFSTAKAEHARQTFCGSTMDGLCHLKGSYDLAPFQYNLAIYPACIKWVRVKVSYGTARRRVIVCGSYRNAGWYPES